MHTFLPHGIFGSWTITLYRDSIKRELNTDERGETLKLFFYAVTVPGWTEVKVAVNRWRRKEAARKVVAYVGTDHAITDPDVLSLMQDDHVEVFLMQTYRGVFHPKVIWLEGATGNIVWVGSNNLTKDGLDRNIELAVMIRSRDVPADLRKWASRVASGSVRVTPGLLKSYQTERQKFESTRAASGAMTFTWSQKKEPSRRGPSRFSTGSLVVEIMPRETGMSGKQIQLPLAVADRFFGLRRSPGAQKTVRLFPKGHKGEWRDLTMTVFRNNTVRLSVNELEYRDRPCVIIFKNMTSGMVEFEIVSESIFPSRYKSLLARCNQRTRAGSRRWAIL